MAQHMLLTRESLLSICYSRSVDVSRPSLVNCFDPHKTLVSHVSAAVIKSKPKLVAVKRYSELHTSPGVVRR